MRHGEGRQLVAGSTERAHRGKCLTGKRTRTWCWPYSRCQRPASVARIREHASEGGSDRGAAGWAQARAARRTSRCAPSRHAAVTLARATRRAAEGAEAFDLPAAVAGRTSCSSSPLSTYICSRKGGNARAHQKRRDLAAARAGRNWCCGAAHDAATRHAGSHDGSRVGHPRNPPDDLIIPVCGVCCSPHEPHPHMHVLFFPPRRQAPRTNHTFFLRPPPKNHTPTFPLAAKHPARTTPFHKILQLQEKTPSDALFLPLRRALGRRKGTHSCPTPPSFSCLARSVAASTIIAERMARLWIRRSGSARGVGSTTTATGAISLLMTTGTGWNGQKLAH